MASTTPYIINFNKKNSVFTLTSTKDELKVDAKHKKYEWLKSQDAGRIVKISDKGRWNSSKDYIGLYDEINSSTSKKKKSTVKSLVKTTKRKTKSVKDNSTELKELKTQLKELQTSNNKLKTENTKLKNEIQLLKKKSAPTRTKTKLVVKKKWKAKFIVDETCTCIYTKKRKKETKNVSVYTKAMGKKPSERFLKAQLKSFVANNYNHNVDDISGLGYISAKLQSPKITNINLVWIREY